jgi:glycosyltransferase involved in cell wall biosynthesis
MKVLHILNELLPSGAETMLRLAAEPWRTQGLELEVLSLGDEVGTYAETLVAAGYRIHHIPLRPLTRSLPAFVGLLRRGGYDVVHVHPERANFFLALIARSVGRAGVIRTVHNVFGFEGRLRLERRLQRALLRVLGVVHAAVGESVQDNELSRFGNTSVLVLNTFDESRFRPATEGERDSARRTLGLASSDFVAVVIGNCSRVKNHGVLIEALAHPLAPRTKLLHLGLEAEDATGERRLAQHLGVAHEVSFLGFVDDVPSVLHAADCYVMPSLYEGLAVTALETLGCGVPSVLTDVPGLRDLREHLPMAWWVTPSAEPIAVALQEVAELDGEARRRWTNQAAAMVRERFGVERHVSSYLELYVRVRRRGTHRLTRDAGSNL